MTHPDAARVRELFDYDPSTGILTWRQSAGSKRAGKRAGHQRADGYRTVSFDTHKWIEHRVVWLWVYGELPTQQIDHISRDRSDNRIANLRDVSARVNQRNRAVCVGIDGQGATLIVNKRHGRRWAVRLRDSEGTQTQIGVKPTREEAEALLEVAKERLAAEPPRDAWCREDIVEVLMRPPAVFTPVRKVDSRHRIMVAGGKRVEAHLDAESKARWLRLLPQYGSGGALMAAALRALERSAHAPTPNPTSWP